MPIIYRRVANCRWRNGRADRRNLDHAHHRIIWSSTFIFDWRRRFSVLITPFCTTATNITVKITVAGVEVCVSKMNGFKIGFPGCVIVRRMNLLVISRLKRGKILEPSYFPSLLHTHCQKNQGQYRMDYQTAHRLYLLNPTW